MSAFFDKCRHFSTNVSAFFRHFPTKLCTIRRQQTRISLTSSSYLSPKSLACCHNPNYVASCNETLWTMIFIWTIWEHEPLKKTLKWFLFWQFLTKSSPTNVTYQLPRTTGSQDMTETRIWRIFEKILHKWPVQYFKIKEFICEHFYFSFLKKTKRRREAKHVQFLRG